MPSSGRTPRSFATDEDAVELGHLLEDQDDLLLHAHAVQAPCG
jgi:hypothetical protein